MELSHRSRENCINSRPDPPRVTRFWEIGELVCGTVPRREDHEITILKNNGLSVQFAGVGAAVMQRAKERGLGRELPSYLFEAAYRT